MRLDHLEVFVALADERHFGRAAARLGISTSGLSKRLQDLEASTGIRLFDRTSRRVDLTPEAKPLLDQARRVLDEAGAFGALVVDTREGEAATVRLYHASSHFDIVASLVRTLRGLHPRLVLQYMERNPGEIAAAVLSGEADIGVCWGPIPPGLSIRCIDVLLLDTVFVPPDHRLAGRDAIDLAELDGETFILTGPDPAELWRHAGIAVEVRRMPIGGREEIATRVETGEGLVLTASRAVPRYRHRAVVPVPLADPATWGQLEQSLVWRTDNDSPAVGKVVEAADDLHPVAPGIRSASPPSTP
jgi:DNA-binding transcriptional LysR family regulator